ncbi:uncharacterized protein RSE6_11741 [Rhynchosporium secalis]|uniref:HTH psq-type domain-containing protein n=1 Tax=Rhynchosporium secalis TaxID=38038 RepID=A0A1E1MNR7_RHYSE|nr:uncharacterized protein RSE6_11741 [Rhynchosporium secalis]
MAQPNSVQLTQKEGRIALAVQAFKQGHISSVRAAAKAYNVPESTLRGHVKGLPARRDIVPTTRKRTTIEESTLVEWVGTIYGLARASTYSRCCTTNGQFTTSKKIPKSSRNFNRWLELGISSLVRNQMRE